jgi:hypothetical protein
LTVAVASFQRISFPKELNNLPTQEIPLNQGQICTGRFCTSGQTSIIQGWKPSKFSGKRTALTRKKPFLNLIVISVVVGSRVAAKNRAAMQAVRANFYCGLWHFF